MKAQRRHELQSNELAKVIKGAPTFWEDWGGRALVAAIAVLVIVILVRYKISSNRESMTQATSSLATAREQIDGLAQMAMVSPLAPAQEVAVRRRTMFNDGNNAIGEAIRRSDDKKIQAEALVAKGDLYWTLASLPPVVGAATQPSLQIKDPKDLIAGAQESYQTVVNNYADDKYALITARLGLGAIAENKREFDVAKTQYDKLAAETKDFPAYQRVIADRLATLERIRTAVVFGKETPDIEPSKTPSTMAIPDLLRPPTTAPATTVPAAVAAAATPQATTAPAATANIPATTVPASAPTSQPK